MTTTDSTPKAAPQQTSSSSAESPWIIRLWWISLAALSWIPFILARPGQVMADTKAYLYLNPTRLLSSAQSMWNPDVGMGTVTHQNMGYLFPMGPFYWLVDQLGIPMWLGQRFWMGALVFAAGAGIYVLCKELGISMPGRIAASLLYALTPYIIDYIARMTAILMPWAGLGWMMVFTIWAARRGGWRYPALFGLVIALVGGVNATSILFVGLAPVAWLLYASFVTRELRISDAAKAALKIGLLSLLASIWWIAGLWAEGAYGINILKYTETFTTVTMTSLASEIFRGLGYWYFYGQDKLQPWTSPAGKYMLSRPVSTISFLVPLCAIALGLLARWKHRLFAVILIVLGTVLAVGAYPLADPTPLGRLIKQAGEGSTVGLAMRSSNRILPIIILGMALLLASGVSAIAARSRRLGWVTGLSVSLLIMANLSSLFNGSILPTNLARQGNLPSYVHQAARYLNGTGGDTRVLAIPGSDFAYYRYGTSMDSVWPGLLKRPFVGRQAVVQGQPASVNLLRALDESLQDGVFDPSTLAPMARLMSAGNVLLQSDVQVERFGMPRPQALWLQLQPTPQGLNPAISFGTPGPLTPIKYPLIDETQLGLPVDASQPPPLASFRVQDPRPISRTESNAGSILMAGDGNGLLEASAAGILSGNPFIAYSSSMPLGSARLKHLLKGNPSLILTDTNARRENVWGTLHDTYGFVMAANEVPLGGNPGEQPMPIDQGGSDTQTVAQYSSVKSVRASSYANPITNEPENQASRAFDQIPSTAWTEGAFTSAVNARLNVQLNSPVTTNHITVLQPLKGSRNRKITRMTLTLDGRHQYHFTLTKASYSEPGQQLNFPSQTFSSINVKVNMTNKGIQKSYVGFSGVGFSEVRIPGVGPARESLRLPTDLLTKAGSLHTPLVIMTSRLRAPIVPPRFDPELALSRIFETPATRSFAASGQIRASAEISDAMLNDILGRSHQTGYTTPQSVATIVQTNSLSRLNGAYAHGSWESADADPKTSWTPSFGKRKPRWLTYDFNRPVSIDHLNLQLVNDGRHSQVRQIQVSAGGVMRTVDIPKLALGSGRPIGAVTSVRVSFPSIYGQQLSILLTKLKVHYTTDYIAGAWIATPPAIAEIGIPGVVEPPTPTELPAICYPAMLSVDGHLVGVRVTGSTQTALSGGAVQLSACGGGFSTLTLSSGKHDIETQAGPTYGWNIDSLNLSSAADGSALIPDAAGHINLPNAATVGHVKTQASNRSGRSLDVPAAEAGKWLVFGQSFGPGWSATANGHDLGDPSLADGYAMAWPLPSSSPGGKAFHVVLTWTPQRSINIAQLLSLISLIAIAFLMALGRGRRKRGAKADEAATLTSLWRYEGKHPGFLALTLISLLLGVTCWMIFTPWAGVAVAAGMLLAGRLRWSRWIASFGFVLVVLWAAALVLVGQFQGKFLWNIQWPNHFHLSSQLIWLAICLLLADATLSHLYGVEKENDDDAKS